MRKLGLPVAMVLALALGCSASPPGPPEVASPAPSSALLPQGVAGQPRALVTGLEVPWGVAFLPDGAALVTERMSARLLRVTPAGGVDRVGVVGGVEPNGEGGLLGIAVSPGFAQDRAVFVYYTSGSDNRVVRLQVGGDGRIDGSAAAQRVVVSGIPAGSIHDGGQVAFGPDGMLYVATGEAGRRDPAQDLGDLGGKVLRMTPGGAPAPGNPFGTLVWSYGHRNVQGLAWDGSGRLYATEFGQNTFDEVNRIEPGRNYGWPIVEGFGRRPGLTDPLLTWAPSEASPSGLAFGAGSLWAAALRGSRLWRIPVAADGSVAAPQALFAGQFGRLRSVTPTPDGRALWLTTSNRDGRGDPGPDDDRILVLPLS